MSSQQPLVNIPAIFGEVVDRVAAKLKRSVYFDFGKLREVSRRLQQKDGGTSSKGKKYPLVWLVMNYAENYGDTDEYCELKGITIMICELTETDLSTADRIKKTFIPTLYPIYQALIEELGDCGFFDHTGVLDFKHQKIDCPYWNEDMKAGDKNQFADNIDAIQLRDLAMTVNQSTCDRFRLIAEHDF